MDLVSLPLPAKNSKTKGRSGNGVIVNPSRLNIQVPGSTLVESAHAALDEKSEESSNGSASLVIEVCRKEARSESMREWWSLSTKGVMPVNTPGTSCNDTSSAAAGTVLALFVAVSGQHDLTVGRVFLLLWGSIT